jgi:hypothetical protein
MTEKLPAQLKMATFALSSRFAEPQVTAILPSSAKFAKLATDLLPVNASCPDMNEIKTSFLLCLYNLSETLSWNSVAEIGKLIRMVEIYAQIRTREGHSVNIGSSNTTGTSPLEGFKVDDAESEEWNSVWWCIYALETCSSALA